MNEVKVYDLVIVGAGPAGLACAISLKDKGFKVALIEKHSFPKDKICGDALGPDILNQLEWIDPKLRAKLDAFERKIKCEKVLISIDGDESVDFSSFDTREDRVNFGYIVRRKDFDQLLFDWLKESNHVDVFENCDVLSTKVNDTSVLTATSVGLISSKMIFAADGVHSFVKKQLHNDLKLDRVYHAGALRQYYKGVTGFKPGAIELHFIKGILPGYFWVFPLSDNEANVGIGSLSSAISKKKLNLKSVMDDIIENHPNFKSRFEGAEALESKKGYGLPLGGKSRTISGNRYLLLGDAASIIDPSTGEGIANAIRSGRFAAHHFIEAMQENDFSANYNLKYDKKLYNNILGELKLSKFIQRVLAYSWILKFCLKRFNTSKEFQKYLVEKAVVFNSQNPFLIFKLIFKFIIGK